MDVSHLIGGHSVANFKQAARFRIQSECIKYVRLHPQMPSITAS